MVITGQNPNFLTLPTSFNNKPTGMLKPHNYYAKFSFLQD
ncbi:hypothetical protein BSPWISOX_998 [uncultured Gammaproteobacteria bacterium]|nr:hypothetical protein BSPCLSOX_1226 [uncultured Gammaproteobacteria bacterium]VVH61857.1 hypothetical protein BSPWISOX_748 [uncultured Gammaproteobacteria bacterium]VVH63715.1 hypothetical protein BSPWISOX_998 [uncultured Gammaproteobacteria bacterium]